MNFFKNKILGFNPKKLNDKHNNALREEYGSKVGIPLYYLATSRNTRNSFHILDYLNPKHLFKAVRR